MVTGLSGSGRGTALKWFEDKGFEAVDNLPLSLVIPLLRGRQADMTEIESDWRDNPARDKNTPPRKVAICLDVRSRDFSADRLLELVEELQKSLGLRLFILYLESDDDQLLRRFTETRRKHPLAEDRPIRDGILAERAMYLPIRAEANLILDTTGWSPHDLRRRLDKEFSADRKNAIALTIMSFSFKNGVPRESDMVFDVRFLTNPHWQDELRPLDGRDQKIGEFIEQDPDFKQFFDHLLQLLMPLWSRFHAEGKSYVTIAFGCSGGRHRSVYIAEKLAAYLRSNPENNRQQKTPKTPSIELSLVHRDLIDINR